MQTHLGPQHTYSTPTRGPAPPIRGWGRAQTDRDGVILGKGTGGAIVQQEGGRGVV